MPTNRLSHSRHREDVRAWWADHLAAQRKSGQTQAAYCRARGLDPKYFTLWKSKLRQASAASPRMVPVVVTPSVEPPVSAVTETVPASTMVTLRLSLGNGLSLSLEIAPGALPAVVRELSRLRC